MKNKLIFISCGKDGHIARLEKAGRHGVNLFLKVSPFGCWEVMDGEKLLFSLPQACQAPHAIITFAGGYFGGKFAIV